MPEPGRRQTEPVRRQDFGCYSNAERGEYVFCILVKLVDFNRFSQTFKGFKEKFYDILLKVCTKTFSESSSVTGNDERRPKDGKFPTLDGGDPGRISSDEKRIQEDETVSYLLGIFS